MSSVPKRSGELGGCPHVRGVVLCEGALPGPGPLRKVLLHLYAATTFCFSSVLLNPPQISSTFQSETATANPSFVDGSLDKTLRELVGRWRFPLLASFSHLYFWMQHQPL